MKTKFTGIAAALLCGAQLFNAAQAVDINMSGTLVAPPCMINSDAPVIVDFGNVDMTTLATIDTPYQITPQAIPVNCPVTTGTPTLTITGAAHDAAAGTIETSKYTEGLVAYILQTDGITPVKINEGVDISSSLTGGNLNLNFALGIKEAGLLVPGAFSATATMALTYL
ncbi:fimbrial protein [Enterobacter mori]|uniref:fimbrial protein n=1 Tax=Enterobacter mori TaxID=539813 RepID=UPI003B83C630